MDAWPIAATRQGGGFADGLAGAACQRFPTAVGKMDGWPWMGKVKRTRQTGSGWTGLSVCCRRRLAPASDRSGRGMARSSPGLPGASEVPELDGRVGVGGGGVCPCACVRVWCAWQSSTHDDVLVRGMTPWQTCHPADMDQPSAGAVFRSWECVLEMEEERAHQEFSPPFSSPPPEGGSFNKEGLGWMACRDPSTHPLEALGPGSTRPQMYTAS